MSERRALDPGADRLRSLVSVGASSAAAAMAHLLGSQVLASPPQPRAFGADDAGDAGDGKGAAVMFEASGSISGVIGLVLPKASQDAVLRVLLRHEDESNLADEVAESALRELGNIVASQTVSAIANVLGARILLSVPKLVIDDVGEVLRSLGESERRRPFECDLRDRDGEFPTRLIFNLHPA